MKQLTLLLPGIILLFIVSCKPKTGAKESFKNYEQLDDSVMVFYQNEQWGKAIQLLEKHMNQFPEKQYESEWALIVLHTCAKQYSEALKVIKKGNEKNNWYGISPDSELFKPLQKLEGYASIIAKNNHLKQLAKEKSKPQSIIDLPSNYTHDRKYPLFIALHGWGEDVPFFKKFWHSELLKKEYIVLFVQSSQVANMKGFAWTDTKLAQKEITNAYRDILDKYAINENQVIIGGFSQGASTSLNLCLQNRIPVRGFISLCPGKPESFTPDLVKEMNNRKLRGVILTGEFDNSLEQQKEMMAQFKSLDFPCSFTIEKNISHWFPDDLNKKIEEGISYILKQ
ncbi:MAG: hypothetical protein ACEPOZ_20285 [Marinifilaceae bacterium]